METIDLNGNICSNHKSSSPILKMCSKTNSMEISLNATEFDNQKLNLESVKILANAAKNQENHLLKDDTNISNNSNLSYSSIGSPNNCSVDQIQLIQQQAELTEDDLCSQHNLESLDFFCRNCSSLLCNSCLCSHACDPLAITSASEIYSMQTVSMMKCVAMARSKMATLLQNIETINEAGALIMKQRKEAEASIEKTYNFFLQMIQERRDEILNELFDISGQHLAYLETKLSKVTQRNDELVESQMLIDTLLPLPYHGKFVPLRDEICAKIGELLEEPEEECILQDLTTQTAFYSSVTQIQNSVKNTFGQLLSNLTNLPTIKTAHTDPSVKPDDTPAPVPPIPISSNENGQNITSGHLDNDEISRSIVPSLCRSLDMRRLKMEYHCKFGEFGSEAGQFTEPSGLAVSRNHEILIADANNHRIQAFDSSGSFRRIIGQHCSKLEVRVGANECDLVYPNRLAVNLVTGDIYVTERSPTHQVRVYDESGKFIRRFGAHVLQHPRGITVDKCGRVIVIECKVMRVVIFNSSGSVLNRFIVEKKVNFPNGVAVNDKEEIFISDNRRHGVVVFDYQGVFLRTIGGIGITNYPIGVGINSLGEVIVADNHNNFNVTIFTQEGQLVRALESRVKHAQCFDTALMGDESIILSSKDFRVYIYNFRSTETTEVPNIPVNVAQIPYEAYPLNGSGYTSNAAAYPNTQNIYLANPSHNMAEMAPMMPAYANLQGSLYPMGNDGKFMAVPMPAVYAISR